MSNEERLNDYDSEPVKYCSRCYSLKIKYEEAIDAECCAECGCSDVFEASIEEWEKKYEQRYGHKFTVKNNDLKESPYFKMPIKKLKVKVYDHPKWQEIIKSVYPAFPKGLSREESVILLFDKLSKDGRMDDLRLTMVKLARS